MSAANRLHRPTAELRAIQPRQWNIRLYLPHDRLLPMAESAAVADNFRKYKDANWRWPARQQRRRQGMHGRGYQRLSAAGYKAKGDKHIAAPAPDREQERLAA